jgi:hypothetical protein
MQGPKGCPGIPTVPRRHRGNLRFCVRLRHTLMVLRYLCLTLLWVEGHASPRGDRQKVRLGMSMTCSTTRVTMLNEGQQGWRDNPLREWGK